VWPQAPQLWTSVCRSAHLPLQCVWPGAQVTWQVPLTQVWPLAQAVPQAPQCCGLFDNVTQVPAHNL
jgi:hypothetical protein